jgi:hypothetical protein
VINISALSRVFGISGKKFRSKEENVGRKTNFFFSQKNRLFNSKWTKLVGNPVSFGGRKSGNFLLVSLSRQHAAPLLNSLSLLFENVVYKINN